MAPVLFDSFSNAPIMSGGQTTITIESHRLPTLPAATKGNVPSDDAASNKGLLSSSHSHTMGETGGQDPDPTPRAEASQRWNDSRRNIFKMLSTFVSFLVMGSNDAAYGPMIPYLMKHYDISHTIVSLVFLSPFVGYVGSALLNNFLHLKTGQRGIALISSASHILAYTVIALHPPYVVLVFAFILAGFGNGTADAAWNAWVGNLVNSSELLGFLHAFYGVGGVVAPLIATALITKVGLPWYTFYYIMIGLAALEAAAVTSAFWKCTGAAYREQYKANEIEKESALWDALFVMPAARVSWTCALFLLGYVGVEVALGGWIVLFMIEVRNGSEFNSGMSAVGFWLGITVGRAILGFVTARIGIKLSTAIYIAATVVLQLIFWLVPQFYVSVVAVALQGFFLGPLFPAAVLVASKLLPRHQHVVVIGFAAAFGGCGAAVLPFVTGLLASGAGVQVLQPIVLALLVAILAIWLCLPRINKKKE